MVTTRASKRRRKSHDNPPEEAEQEQPPQSEESDGDIKKSAGISPVVVLAHGAGAPSSSDWMVRYHFLATGTNSRLRSVTSSWLCSLQNV